MFVSAEKNLIAVITKLKPRPGDLVMVFLERPASRSEIEGITRQLKELPALNGVTPMIVTEGISLELLDETDMRNAGWQRIPAAE